MCFECRGFRAMQNAAVCDLQAEEATFAATAGKATGEVKFAVLCTAYSKTILSGRSYSHVALPQNDF